MTEFADRLSALCSSELADARGDDDRIGTMIERLVNSLAFTIAVAAKGDREAMEKLLSGADAYLYAAATGHQPLGRFMNNTKRK